MPTMELVGTIGGDGFLSKKYFYQCPECKMIEIYSSSYDIPDPNDCNRCKSDKCIVCGKEQEVPQGLENIMFTTYDYGKKIAICDNCIKNKSILEIDETIKRTLKNKPA